MNLTPKQWLELKQTTRDMLVKIFKITRSGATHVVNTPDGGYVESDGYTYEDLHVLSVENMKELTQLESDSFEQQFNMVINMVESDGSSLPVIESTEKDATQNEQSASAPEAAGVDSGAESGSQSTEENSQGEVLPVSGGSNEDSGRSTDVVPTSGDDNSSSVAAENVEVDSEKPKARRAAR